MSPNIARLRLAIAMTLLIGAQLHAADVVVQPAAGSGFAVKDSTGAQLRLRVDENGNIVMPVLVDGAQQNLPVCVGSGGQIGPCAPSSGAGSAFKLPYAGNVSATGTAFSVANTGAGNAVNGQGNTGSGVYGLSGTASGETGAAGVWGDTSSYFGIWGTSVSNDGVHGDSQSLSGVFGGSNTGAGVFGASTSGDGVSGHSASTSGGVAMRGVGTGPTWGVVGASDSGNGVFGQSAGAGVWGESTGYDAIHGHTSNPNGNTSGVAGFGDGNNNGTFGLSQQGAGVVGLGFNYGSSIGVFGDSGVDGVRGHSSGGGPSSSGVSGHGDGASNGVGGWSQSGAGVFGHSDTGYGMTTDGSAQQARDQGGWVKAMALVDGGSGQILRCFNSSEDRAHASTPPCGMWVDGSRGFGLPSVCFPFEVDDRFFQISPVQVEITSSNQSPTQATYFAPYSSNCATVFTSDSSGTFIEARFFIFVF